MPDDKDGVGWVPPLARLRVHPNSQRALVGLAEFVDRTRDLPPVVNAFSDDVLVMDPDPAIRAGRLALLRRLAAVSGRVLDWSAL